MSRVRGWRLGLGGFGIGELEGLSLSPFCNATVSAVCWSVVKLLVMGKFVVDPSNHGRREERSRVTLGIRGAEKVS